MTPDPPWRVRCELCGEVIGVYEPLVLDGPAGPVDTSLTAAAWLTYTLERPGCFHRDCYTERPANV